MVDQTPGRRILIVDDEAHILHVLTLKLANAGYDVLTAEDGQEGLDAVFNESPDLVITDYQMPRMTGLEMARAIHADPRFQSLPILMLSARGFRLADEELTSTGIADLLSKPFSPRDVLSRVEALLTPIAPIQE